MANTQLTLSESAVYKGAAGHHGWHKIRTLLRFKMEAAKLSGVEAIELGPRGRNAASRSTC